MIDKRKILIDTDNGDDIDDLLAIYMALAMKEVDIVGFTTTYLNTNLRARQIKKVLDLAKKDIPVYAGIGTPLKGMHFWSTDVKYCQYSEELDLDKYAPINESEGCHGLKAIDFMIESAQKYQDELTIICIGPLTNLAYAIKKDRDAFKNTKIVLMGGCFFMHQREWNIECDIDAAEIVFNSKLDVTCIGIDVTIKTEISAKLQKHYLAAKHEGYMGYLVESIKRWVDYTGRRIILHDPLTVYYAIHHEICKTQKVHVYVENTDPVTKGLTINMQKLLWVGFNQEAEDKYPAYECAFSVKKQEFIDIFNDLVRI